VRALLCVLAGCGRIGFSGVAPDGEASGIVVLADFSGDVPYNPTDFLDGGMLVDNGPGSVGALYAPFPDGFAVTAGRAVIEIRLDGSSIVHDYRPAVPDVGGPDNLASISFGPLARMWLAAESWSGGDGLFYVDAAWQLGRENTTNNVEGVAFDPAGAFDDQAKPTLYFNAGNLGVLRRDDATTSTSIFASTADVGSVTITASTMYAVDSVANTTARLWRIDAMTHTTTQLDASSEIELPDGTPADTAIPAIRDEQSLVAYAPDGSWTPIATAPDADTYWTGLCVPRAPHPLAGRIVVLETNHVLGRDRLLLMPP
jgi:hypothetical protein